VSAAECWVERTRPQRRRINLRPYVAALRLLPDCLEMDLIVTPNGTARPDEVTEALGLAGWPGGGAVVERTRLFLHDEITNPGPVPAPVSAPVRESPSSEEGDSGTGAAAAAAAGRESPQGNS